MVGSMITSMSCMLKDGMFMSPDKFMIVESGWGERIEKRSWCNVGCERGRGPWQVTKNIYEKAMGTKAVQRPKFICRVFPTRLSLTEQIYKLSGSLLRDITIQRANFETEFAIARRVSSVQQNRHVTVVTDFILAQVLCTPDRLGF